LNPCVAEILQHTIGDHQATARVKEDSIESDASAVKRQPTQNDGVARPDADGDGVSAGGWHDACLDTVRTGDGDGFGDDNRSEAGTIDGGNLAAGSTTLTAC